MGQAAFCGRAPSCVLLHGAFAVQVDSGGDCVAMAVSSNRRAELGDRPTFDLGNIRRAEGGTAPVLRVADVCAVSDGVRP